MDPLRWRQIETVFKAALDVEVKHRSAFLSDMCGADLSLMREVEALLAADQRPDGVLDRMSPVRAPRHTRFSPPEAFASYQRVAFLGAGGRGAVYKAFDRKLDRFVALKFMHHATPVLARRALREARAQARVDHPNICKVFETGEYQGQPFIAMQYVDGQSLAEAKKDLSLAERVRAVEDVAGALHAAHEGGLIHRDVKPANIMVEKHADGWRPYITDFGLARDAELSAPVAGAHAGHTTVEGTPGYMPPEQVRGDRALMDRRIDVYALGASLYALVSGHPPLTGDDPMAVMQAPLEQAPTRLRDRYPDVPRDLDAIVMKCLAPMPDDRYPTARELADELRRYRTGEPIHARPATVRYVLGKKLRKHLIASLAAVLAVLGLVACIALMVRERERAARQAELAQAFGLEAAHIQDIVRHAHMAPLHDIRAEYKDVRARMAALERRMRETGTYAEGPGHCALGMGHVAIREFDRGLEHLQRAWQRGVRSAVCEYALGDALYWVYIARRWGEVVPVQDSNRRALAQARLEAEYRAPALAHMRASLGRSDAEYPAYVAAQIALVEEHFDDAIAGARASLARTPWLYEARLLEAQALVGLVVALPEASTTERASGLEGARHTLEQALEVGRSDPGLYIQIAAILKGLSRVERARGRSADALAELALEACDKALQADPDDRWALINKAWVLYYQGRDGMGRGDPNAVSNLEQAIALGERADAIGATYGQARGLLGDAYMTLGWYRENHGQDPRQAMERAYQLFQEAADAQPESGWLWNDLGVLACSRARVEARHGGSEDDRFGRCIEALDRSVGRYEFSHSNLAWAFGERARHEVDTGRDPRASVTQALAHARRAIELQPDNFNAHDNAALALLAQAEYELDSGQDALTTLSRAHEMSQAALAIDGHDLEAHRHLALEYLVRARDAAARGQEPWSLYDQGRDTLEQAVAIAARDPQVHLLRARLELLAARAALLRNRAAEVFLAHADAALTRADSIGPDSPEVALLRAQYYLYQAAARPVSGHRDRPHFLAQGQEAIATALEKTPGVAQAWAVKSALWTAQAALEPDEERARAAMRAGEQARRRALHLNPLLSSEHGTWPVASSRSPGRARNL